MSTQAFVHTVQVEQHDVRFRQLLQEIDNFQQLFTLNPNDRNPGAGGLNGKCIRPKTVAQFADDRIIKVIAGLPCGRFLRG